MLHNNTEIRKEIKLLHNFGKEKRDVMERKNGRVEKIREGIMLVK